MPIQGATCGVASDAGLLAEGSRLVIFFSQGRYPQFPHENQVAAWLLKNPSRGTIRLPWSDVSTAEFKLHSSTLVRPFAWIARASGSKLTQIGDRALKQSRTDPASWKTIIRGPEVESPSVPFCQTGRSRSAACECLSAIAEGEGPPISRAKGSAARSGRRKRPELQQPCSSICFENAAFCRCVFARASSTLLSSSRYWL